MRIGEIIKRYRDEHGETMRSLAERLGVSHGYIAMLEKGVNNKTGKEPAPSIYFFADFARLAGISVDELLRMTDRTQPVTIPPHMEYSEERQALLHIVETLPEERLAEAARYLRYLAGTENRNAKGA